MEQELDRVIGSKPFSIQVELVPDFIDELRKRNLEFEVR